MTLPLLLVDAFTDRALGGTPHTVILDADDLSDHSMQAIAREMNYSETAFVSQSSLAAFAVRYFSPSSEVPIAGSPTTAAVHALLDTGRLALAGKRTPLTLELKDQLLEVEVMSVEGGATQIVLTLPEPVFHRTYQPAAVVAAFSLETADIRPDVPIQTISAGLPQLMVPVRDHDVLRRVRFDWPAYQKLQVQGDFSSAFLFCLGGITTQGQTFARHFGAPPDFEDAATGSATGAMAAYLWHYGLLTQPNFTAEQGHWMGRPSTINAEVIGARHAIESVRVGGRAVVVMRGELFI